jgi:hypothetical protein
VKARDLAMLILSAGCGFLGALIASRSSPAAAAASDVVRTSRVELVDASGTARAVLTLDSRTREPQLSFMNSGGKMAASFGLLSGGLPAMSLIGSDGAVRGIFQLTSNQLPTLAMGDSGWEGRILLGAIEGDVPSSKSDWALQFRGSGQVPVLSSIGMIRNPNTELLSGVLGVHDAKGKTLASYR